MHACVCVHTCMHAQVQGLRSAGAQPQGRCAATRAGRLRLGMHYVMNLCVYDAWRMHGACMHVYMVLPREPISFNSVCGTEQGPTDVRTHK